MPNLIKIGVGAVLISILVGRLFRNAPASDFIIIMIIIICFCILSNRFIFKYTVLYHFCQYLAVQQLGLFYHVTIYLQNCILNCYVSLYPDSHFGWEVNPVFHIIDLICIWLHENLQYIVRFLYLISDQLISLKKDFILFFQSLFLCIYV